jgi:DNA-binding transcriptional MerR regulator
MVRISRLAQLAGVPVSTLKHYMRVGLLPPPLTRPNRQMAYYDEGLVDRVVAIKILQTERYLPLPAIKKILGAPPEPGEVRGEAIKARELAALEPALQPPASGWLNREALLATFRVSERELATLEAVGLITARVADDGARGYADTDLELLRVIHETRVVGLGELFPMDVLAPYVNAIRGLVKLELDMFRHRMQSGVSLPDLPLTEIAQLAQKLGERLVILLRRKLVLLELRGLERAARADEAGTRATPAAAVAPSKPAAHGPTTRTARAPRRARKTRR